MIDDLSCFRIFIDRLNFFQFAELFVQSKFTICFVKAINIRICCNKQ